MVWSLSAGTADYACMERLLHNVGYPPRRVAELSGHLACPTQCLWVGRFPSDSPLQKQNRALYAREDFHLGPQALSQTTLIHIGDSLGFWALPGSRAIRTLHAHLQTCHAGIASMRICASADLWIDGVTDLFCADLGTFWLWRALPLAPLFSAQKVRRTHAGGKQTSIHPTCPWKHGCLAHIVFLLVTLVGATHPCVSNHDDPMLHLALWHGHV